MAEQGKPIRWMGSSLEDLRDFPRDAMRAVGHALREAQDGLKPLRAKPMEGFKGATVMKIVEDHDGSTYRAVYTVKFEEAVYVLHCFQKKSKSGIATPRQELDLIRWRFRMAQEEHKR
ncbi:MAG: type II toxin-antitoxin system RelE/ParE family toxin [Fimbriimonadales bacterium]